MHILGRGLPRPIELIQDKRPGRAGGHQRIRSGKTEPQRHYTEDARGDKWDQEVAVLKESEK